MKKYLENKFDAIQVVKMFDEIPFWSAAFGLKLLEYVNYKPNITVLDIAFGTGFPLLELAMRLGDDSTVYGIEPWKEAIDKTKEKVDFYGLSNVKIIEGFAEKIPLADNYIDLITSNNGLNNVIDLEKAISECSRIIKIGGQFIQTMNLDTAMFEFYSILEKVLFEMEMDKEIDLMEQHIRHKRPPISYFQKMLSKNGFTIKDIEQDQFNYQFATGTAMLNHYFIRLAFVSSWMELIPADKLEIVFDTVEERLNKQAQLMGGIKLSIPYVIINAVKTE